MNPTSSSDADLLLRAAVFAAERHRGQKRKDRAGTPYIHHPLQVAALLAKEGRVTDPTLLAAALLHDTLEDTDTTPEELEQHFGREVRDRVEEVTDDKSLPKQVRKRLQIENAPLLSEGARQIKIADKICNVRDLAASPPRGWSPGRVADYVEWAQQVVAGCRGVNPALDTLFDSTIRGLASR